MPRDLRPAPTPFLRWPDPRLATSGARAIRADAPTLAQLELLAEILERYGLPALAGPQIGVMRRLAVMRVDGRAEPMLNPALVWASRDRQAVEATSPNFPGVRAAVERAAVATLGWTTPGGERREKVFSGPRAAEAQAMLDAVEGRPLIDLLDPAERRRALRDMALAKAGGGPGAPDAPPGAEPDAAPAPAPMDPPAAPSPDAEESPKGPAMRLIFMGTPDFSVLALDALVAAGHEIAAVYTQPPRPAGRGKKPRPTPVHARAEALGLEVRHPRSLKGEDEQAALAALGADLAVVVAYGLILPRPVLDAPRLGCVNIHASLLPRWRGAAPIQRAIMAGDAETGVCIMRMEAGLDTGPVLTRRATPIGAADTAETLHDRLAAMGAEMIVEAAALLADGAAEASESFYNRIGRPT